MKNDLLKIYVNNRSCEILGLGVSNLPLAEKLCDMGISLTVRDKKDVSSLGDSATALMARGVRFICGEGAFDKIDGELIFRSPGIRPDIAGISNAVSCGAELTSEMELFLSLTDANTFAITGSDGKTTTTTLTGMFLDSAAKSSGGSTFVGGNIGEPLLYKLDRITSADYAVTELSSFQLMTLKRAPQYVCITNVSQNHLDWHHGMDEYVAAKRSIIGKNTKRLVTNSDCETTLNIAIEASTAEARPDVYLFSSKKSSFESIFPKEIEVKDGDRALFIKGGALMISDGKRDTEILRVADVRLPGEHNLENYMSAIGLTYGFTDLSVYADIAKEFGGVHHRLESVRIHKGIEYFNSSIDSSPSRTAAALSALSGRDIVIICGGYDKKIPYEPLAESLCAHVRAVVLTGQTAKKIEAALLSCKDYEKGQPYYEIVSEFEAAVKRAGELAVSGGCVLLSPASASFDAFKNFAERGDRFTQIVKEL